MLNAMPRLPSLGTLAADAAATARRFPFVLLAAVLAALAAILTADDLGPEALQLRLLAAASLAIPLCTALAVYAEGTAWKTALRIGFQAIGLAVSCAFFAAWPNWSEVLRETRFWELMTSFTLAITIARFLRGERPVAFWQFNAALFVRSVTAAIAAGILFVGLALALLALDKLFGVPVASTGYARLWFVLAFVFSTWFFLGGVPRDLDALERAPQYPAVVKVLAQNILMPLVTMYLVILTLYFAKVVGSWTWPNGWIGWLASSVSVAGVFTIVLLQPIADQPGQKWVGVFTRSFWFGILPAAVMLWLALYQRIRQYGLTEPRYFLLALSVWLGAAALYFGITRSRRIRLIPISLMLLGLLDFAGPWSSHEVARRSQFSRLETLLRRNGLLDAAGQRQVPVRAVTGADAAEISATVRYLVTVHGSDAVRGLLGDSTARRLRLQGKAARQGGEPQVRAIVGAFGVAYALDAARGGGRYSFTARASNAAPTLGYQFVAPVRFVKDTAEAQADTALAAVVIRNTAVVRIQRGADVLLEIPLDSTVVRASRFLAGGNQGEVPGNLMHADAANDRARALVYFASLRGADRKPHPTSDGGNGVALIAVP
jgi:hypothetical protein